jgi:hypothetical protein
MAVSINVKLQDLAPLATSQRLSEREAEFITSLLGWTGNGANCRGMSTGEIAWVERLHRKHFCRSTHHQPREQ